jgi:hypothetical protein
MDMKSESALAAKLNMLPHLAHRACDVDRANLAILISPVPLPDRLSLRFRRPQRSRIYSLRNDAIPVLLRGAHGDARMHF